MREQFFINIRLFSVHGVLRGSRRKLVTSENSNDKSSSNRLQLSSKNF